MPDFKEKVLQLHRQNKGKLDVLPNINVHNQTELSMAYTPGVAIPCLEINQNKALAYEYTMKGKTVAIITDGSAVLGLGQLSPEASLPVMEGKSLLLHQFSSIQAYPLALDTKDPDKIIETICLLAPNFSAIMLEDISAPHCVYIENTLQKKLDIPVFHDDQHGTAIVVCAALINALKVVKKDIKDIKVVVSGLGAAGCAIIKLLNTIGVNHIYGYDLLGVASTKHKEQYHFVIQSLINDRILKLDEKAKNLHELLIDKDVFIGVSAKGVLKPKMIKSMASNPIIFAMANPEPEIHPEDALQAGAKIVGTGRSDFPNQINNVLVFPGLMKGVLKARVQTITDEIKITTAKAIASLIDDAELNENHILPSIFDQTVVSTIEKAIIETVKKGSS